MTNPDIKKFIDFFYNAAIKIRGEKPQFTHGKDGKLVKLALAKLSRVQLEQLATWFLETKKGLGTTIGAMLSYKVLDTLQKDMNSPNFWKELETISSKYFPRPDFTKELLKKFQPFTHQQIMKIQEEATLLERQKRQKY